MPASFGRRAILGDQQWSLYLMDVNDSMSPRKKSSKNNAESEAPKETPSDQPKVEPVEESTVKEPIDKPVEESTEKIEPHPDEQIEGKITDAEIIPAADHETDEKHLDEVILESELESDLEKDTTSPATVKVEMDEQTIAEVEEELDPEILLERAAEAERESQEDSENDSDKDDKEEPKIEQEVKTVKHGSIEESKVILLSQVSDDLFKTAEPVKEPEPDLSDDIMTVAKARTTLPFVYLSKDAKLDDDIGQWLTDDIDRNPVAQVFIDHSPTGISSMLYCSQPLNIQCMDTYKLIRVAAEFYDPEFHPKPAVNEGAMVEVGRGFRIMFEYADFAKKIFLATGSIIGEVRMKVIPAGIYFDSMDGSHICLIDFHLSHEECIFYSCEEGECFQLGLNFEDLGKIAKRSAAGDYLMLSHNPKSKAMAVTLIAGEWKEIPLTDIELLMRPLTGKASKDTTKKVRMPGDKQRVFTVPIIEIDADEINMDSLNAMPFDAEFVMQANELKQIVSDAEIYSEVLNIKTDNATQMVEFSTEGTIGEYVNQFKLSQLSGFQYLDSMVDLLGNTIHDDKANQSTTGSFAIQFLKSVVKCGALSCNGKICLMVKSEAPLKIICPISPQSFLVYYLAPRVEEDTEEMEDEKPAVKAPTPSPQMHTPTPVPRIEPPKPKAISDTDVKKKMIELVNKMREAKGLKPIQHLDQLKSHT
jgi:hypothetical protein